MREELYAEMFDMEQRHWWFRGKHQIVRNLLSRYIKRPEGGGKPRVADLGCGCGMMPYKLRDEYDVVGLDGSPQAVAFAAQRGLKVELGGLPDQIPFEPGTFDAVLMLDVLEHLEFDVASAKAASTLLKPGGILLCTVPAYQWLWTKRDEHHQHYRRYSYGQFKKLFDLPGFRMEVFSFYNSLLFPLAVVSRLFDKLKKNDGLSDLRVPPGPINATFQTAFASERFVLGRLPMPCGLSLLALARRTT